MLKKNNSGLIEQLTVIPLFTVVILFILCALKPRSYFVVDKRKRHRFAIFIISLQVSTIPSILAAKTTRIITRGWKPAQHFQDIY